MVERSDEWRRTRWNWHKKGAIYLILLCFLLMRNVVNWEIWNAEGLLEGWRRRWGNSGSGESWRFIGATFKVSMWERIWDSYFWKKLFLQAAVDQFFRFCVWFSQVLTNTHFRFINFFFPTFICFLVFLFV